MGMYDDLYSVAQIRARLEDAIEEGWPIRFIARAAEQDIVPGLYSALTDISCRMHYVGLVGLSEDIRAGLATIEDFVAVLDQYDNAKLEV